ncbi:MAG TPA: carboxylating nicotinate-nucleotide diphosphorylase [Dehalococcoidia bacterium]|nr:carboxylating nicotinate-nucleotide diphosphorylase [Dehalococcoidia bacterium]
MTTPPALSLHEAHLRRLAENALLEDRAYDDITTAALVPEGQRGRAVLLAKAEGVIAGLPVARAVFVAMDAALRFTPHVEEGARVAPGSRLATLEGAVAPILRAERVALNYLQRLSGIATLTARYVERLQGTGTRLRDTRKTTPGLRTLEKYAVRVGGGTNHRLSLADGVLVKDNHLAALRARGLGIGDAVRLLREANPGMPVQVEVTTFQEAEQALAAGADSLLLDNMPLDEMRRVVALAKGRAVLEASGGITLDNVRQVAETGVDYVSVGAITHSAPALDISLELE